MAERLSDREVAFATTSVSRVHAPVWACAECTLNGSEYGRDTWPAAARHALEARHQVVVTEVRVTMMEARQASGGDG
jgi:hypothetical protein